MPRTAGEFEVNIRVNIGRVNFGYTICMSTNSAKKYWLVKSELSTYSISDLQKDKKTAWTGIRNFQARNFMRDGMRKGDEILFYHSSCAEPGIYGIAKVASAAYPDETQFDKKGNYFEPRATKEKPVWELVDIAFVKKLSKPVLVPQLRANIKLQNMRALQKGNRLSVMPVEEIEFSEILAMV